MTPYVTGEVGNAWSVVPHEAKPGASVAPVTPAAESVQLPPTGTVARILITIDVGTAGVRVLLIRSFLADRETRPFGVTGQEQQATICSSGENVYTFAQMEPPVLALVPEACVTPPRAPVLVMLTTESPMFRLDAYRT